MDVAEHSPGWFHFFWHQQDAVRLSPKSNVKQRCVARLASGFSWIMIRSTVVLKSPTRYITEGMGIDEMTQSRLYDQLAFTDLYTE